MSESRSEEMNIVEKAKDLGRSFSLQAKETKKLLLQVLNLEAQLAKPDVNIVTCPCLEGKPCQIHPKPDEKLREKIAKKLYEQRWVEGQLTWEQSLLKELFRNYARQIIALLPDVRREARQEVIDWVEATDILIMLAPRQRRDWQEHKKKWLEE